MNETQPNQADSDQVIVALEGDAGNLDKLVTVARECGFRKLLSALVKDLQEGASRDDRNHSDGRSRRVAGAGLSASQRHKLRGWRRMAVREETLTTRISA